MRSRRRKSRRVVWLALAVVAAGAALLTWLASYTPPETTAIVTPSEAEHARTAVGKVERELSRTRAAAARGERRPFRVSIDQEDVTNFLRTDKGTSRLLAGRKVEKPKVEFDSHSVTTSAYMTLHGKRLFITVTGSLSQLKPGKLAFRSSSVRVGKLPAPPAIARKVDERINAYLTYGHALPVNMSDIDTDHGQLTMSGVGDPTAAQR